MFSSGYQGNDNTVSVLIRDYERGKDIPPWIDRLAHMYALHGVPEAFMSADFRITDARLNGIIFGWQYGVQRLIAGSA